MQTAICSIAKCENDYLLEWVEYHLRLGFTHIHIYDNNDIDGEKIENVLNKYIGKEIFIHDCRGEKAYQGKAFTQFYKLYGDVYNWIAFIDIDEFITFSAQSSFTNINDYLNTIKGFEIIHLNWMCYGDNDIVEYTSNNIIARFRNPLPFDKHIQYDFPENNHVKSIVKGGLNNIKFTNPHGPDGDLLICDEKAAPIENNSFFRPYSFEILYIRHYVTKTIYEWIKKISRGRATLDALSELYTIEKFFKYNEDNEDKRNIIKQFEIFKDITNLNLNTKIQILEKEVEYQKKENFKLIKDLKKIQSSNAYKIGKFLLKPFTYTKKNMLSKLGKSSPS